MTKHTPISGADLARPDDFTVEGAKTRLAQFCACFKVEPPKLRTRSGRVVMTTDLLAWFHSEGASIDWILCGDPMSMASVYRDKHKFAADVMRAMSTYTTEETYIVMTALEQATDRIKEMRAAAAKL